MRPVSRRGARWATTLLLGSLAVLMGAREYAHPVHTSSTQVHVSGDRKSLAVTLRFFSDDLESALKASGEPVSLATSAKANVDSALSRYLGERVRFGVDGGAVMRGRLSGHDRDNDATLVFMHVPLPVVPARLEIVQRALLELFDDQTNLVHVRVDDKKRSALLRRGNDRAEFAL